MHFRKMHFRKMHFQKMHFRCSLLFLGRRNLLLRRPEGRRAKVAGRPEAPRRPEALPAELHRRASRGRAGRAGRAGARSIPVGDTTADRQSFGKMLLVFGCIGTDFCKKICVLQHFSKSTRLSSWNSWNLAKFSNIICDICKFLLNFHGNCWFFQPTFCEFFRLQQCKRMQIL